MGPERLPSPDSEDSAGGRHEAPKSTEYSYADRERRELFKAVASFDEASEFSTEDGVSIRGRELTSLRLRTSHETEVDIFQLTEKSDSLQVIVSDDALERNQYVHAGGRVIVGSIESLSDLPKLLHHLAQAKQVEDPQLRDVRESGVLELTPVVSRDPEDHKHYQQQLEHITRVAPQLLDEEERQGVERYGDLIAQFEEAQREAQESWDLHRELSAQLDEMDASLFSTVRHQITGDRTKVFTALYQAAEKMLAADQRFYRLKSQIQEHLASAGRLHTYLVALEATKLLELDATKRTHAWLKRLAVESETDLLPEVYPDYRLYRLKEYTDANARLFRNGTEAMHEIIRTENEEYRRFSETGPFKKKRRL